MKNLAISIALAILLSGAPAFGQAVADFSGSWELNPAEGENLGMMAAVKESLTISQTEAELSIAFTDVFGGNTTTRQVTYDLGGDPVTNFTAMGEQSETVAAWVDDRLVVTWTSEGAIAGTTVERTETRSLSDDGFTMTVTSARGSKPPMVMVYEKRE